MTREKDKPKVNQYIKDNYVQIPIKLRTDEDADLIKAFHENTVEGDMTKREFLRSLYYTAPKVPKDLCSISEVENLMMTYRVPRLAREGIINSLRAKCE